MQSHPISKSQNWLLFGCQKRGKTDQNNQPTKEWVRSLGLDSPVCTQWFWSKTTKVFILTKQYVKQVASCHFCAGGIGSWTLAW